MEQVIQGQWPESRGDQCNLVLAGTDHVIEATDHFFKSAQKAMAKVNDDVHDEFADLFQQFQSKYDEPELGYQPTFDDLDDEMTAENEEDIDPELLKILAMQYQYYPANDEELDNYYNRLSPY